MRIVALVLVCSLMLASPAISIKCYVCTNNNNGNCKDNEVTCPTLAMACLKIIKRNRVLKSCSADCSSTPRAVCESANSCKAYCCTSDLCNENTSMKPVMLVTLLFPLLALAGYLM